MATDCIIENWIMKNKTWLGFFVAIIGTWVIAVFGLMLFKYWCFGLPWHDSRISLSNILSLGATISATAVAVFAWMAYKYATEQYLQNQKTKLIFEKKIHALTNICNALIMAKFVLEEQSGSITIWMKDDQKLNSQDLQTSADEAHESVIRLLDPFHKKIDNAIYELIELDILFPHSTNDIKKRLKELKTKFSGELGRAFKPFTDGQIKTREDFQEATRKIYNCDFFEHWEKELKHIAKEF